MRRVVCVSAWDKIFTVNTHVSVQPEQRFCVCSWHMVQPLSVSFLCVSRVPRDFKISAITGWWPLSYRGGSEWSALWFRVHLGCLYVWVLVFTLCYMPVQSLLKTLFLSLGILYGFLCSVSAVSSRAFYDDGSILYLHQTSIFAFSRAVTSHRGHQTLEMWLMWLRNWIFYFILFELI